MRNTVVSTEAISSARGAVPTPESSYNSKLNGTKGDGFLAEAVA